MSAELSLNESALERAADLLADAAALMAEGNVRRPPVQMQSLTGIGEEVDVHLDAIAVAREALADAAASASFSVTEIIADTTRTDFSIADALEAGTRTGIPR